LSMGKIVKFPLKKVKSTATARTIETGVIYCADNLEVMKRLPSESIDLIYIDPPFFSGRKYETIWGDTVEVAYEDYRKGGLDSFISWMTKRLDQMHRLLKPSGSLFVHMDYRAIHHIKTALDKIFGGGTSIDSGSKHMVNEIIWSYSQGGKGKKSFAKKHDTILWYAKDIKKYVFNCKAKEVRGSLTPHKNDSSGKNYGGRMGVDKDNREYVEKWGTGKKKLYRYYIDEGKILEDVWTDINSLQSGDSERVGWDTQKPKKLLKRIISGACKDGGIVADFFCGCGTAVVAAHELRRKYIGCDISDKATKIIRKRLAEIGSDCKEVSISELSACQLKRLNPFDFQDRMVRLLGGEPSERHSGDGGVDGKIISDGAPIQVKQSPVGRPTLDSFYKHLKAHGRGYIVGTDISRDAYAEMSRLEREEGLDLKLLTVEEVLESRKLKEAA